MRWIGQHIVDLVSRFRSDVYLDDISTGTIASGGNLGLDSNNKIVKATEATGDITGVSIQTDTGAGGVGTVTSGDAAFRILGGNGIGVTNSTTTVTVDYRPTLIKILPFNFMSNEEGGLNKSHQFVDNGTVGVRATSNASELYAFVEIPEGMRATSVIIYGSDTGNVVHVYLMDVNANTGLTASDGSGTNITDSGGCVVGTQCDITDTASTATNFLAIEVEISDYANDIVYGGQVTIEAVS